MQGTANSRFARFSYRKVNQVLDLIRGKSVEEAMGMLPWIPRAARVLVAKTLKSAFSNAGKGADPSKVRVSSAFCNHGPVLKRVYPMAMGARALKKKKTCHLTVTVSDEPTRRKKAGVK